jgi:hypothetical protein
MMAAMLRVRDDQLAALQRALQGGDQERADRMAPRVLARLRGLGHVAPLPEGQPDPAPLADIRDDVLVALGIGIRSPDGVTQFCSYRFQLNPRWMERPGVWEALTRPGASEEARLREAHSLLSAF